MCSVCSKMKHASGGPDGTNNPIWRFLQELSTKNKYYYSIPVPCILYYLQFDQRLRIYIEHNNY